MDNASIHHVEQVATLIQNTGLIIYHPCIQPDYDPLEESFAKVKAFLKDNEIIYEQHTFHD